jgi:hypothetical protein
LRRRSRYVENGSTRSGTRFMSSSIDAPATRNLHSKHPACRLWTVRRVPNCADLLATAGER